MRELIRTNDPVLISFIESLLGEAGIEVLVLDRHMSVMEGTIGILTRRVMVEAEDVARARALLAACDIDLPDP